MSFIRSTCPIHLVLPLVEELGEGKQLFEGLTGTLRRRYGSRACAHAFISALCLFAFRLGALGVERSKHFRSHDFRRGCAQDLADAGMPIAKILKAGDWRSAAFALYLDMPGIEAKAVVQTVMQQEPDSDDD